MLAQWLEEGLRGRTEFGVSGAGDLAATLMPKGLIGALWLQAALAITGKADYRQCTDCPTWFALSPEQGRPDKRFCSDACRMRAYRKRRKKAGRGKTREKETVGHNRKGA